MENLEIISQIYSALEQIESAGISCKSLLEETFGLYNQISHANLSKVQRAEIKDLGERLDNIALLSSFI